MLNRRAESLDDIPEVYYQYYALYNTRGNNVGQAHLFNATSGVLLHTFESQILLRGDFKTPEQQGAGA